MNTSSPAWKDPKFSKWAPQRERVQIVLEGTDAVQAAGERFLKRLPRESPANYEIRRTIAEVVNMLAGAVRAAEGLMVSTPPTLNEDASPALQAIWADIDGLQTGGVVWLRDVLRKELGDGWCLAVVSSPVKAAERPSASTMPICTVSRFT